MNKKTTKLMATALTATMGAGIATQLVQAAEVTPYEAALEAVITMEKDPSGANIDKAYNAVVALKAGAQKDALYKRVEAVAGPHHKAVYDIMVTAREKKDLKTIGEARKAVVGMAKIFINDAYTWSSELDTFTLDYEFKLHDNLLALNEGSKKVNQAIINELKPVIEGLALQAENKGLQAHVLDYSANLDAIQTKYIESVAKMVDGAKTEDDIVAAREKYNDLMTMTNEALKKAIASDLGVKLEAKEVELTEARITSVKSLNASTIEIKFNKAVNRNVALGSIYTITKVGTVNTFTVDNTEISEDGKTVILKTNTTGIENGKDYTVVIEGMKFGENDTEQNFAQVLKAVEDKAAPVLVNAYAAAGSTGTNTVYVEFDESVDIAGLKAPVFKVNNSIVPATQSSTDYRGFTLTLPSKVQSGKELAITVENVYDLADNKGKSSINTVVASDLEAPKVVGVKVLSDTSIRVIFDEVVDTTNINTTNFSVTANGLANCIQGIVPDLGNRSVVINLNSATLYTSSIKSRDLTITMKNLTDTFGNKANVDTVKNVTVVKDEVKPVVESISHKKEKIGGIDKSTYYVKLSENVTVTNPSIALKMVDENGVLTTQNGTAKIVDKNGKDTLGSSEYVKITMNDLKANGTYKVTLAADHFTDLATAANTNNAATFTIAVTDGEVSAPVNAPVVNSVTTTAEGVITVTFDKAVNTTAINPSNYKLDNVVLPSNTEITLNTDRTAATITLPDGFVTKGLTNPVLAIYGIQSTDGGQLSSVIKTIVGTIKESVAPVLAKVEYVEDGKLALYFNENTGIKAGAKFSVYNGATAVETDVVITDLADKDGNNDNGVIKLEVAAGLSGLDALNQSTLTVKIAEGYVQDSNDNNIAESVVTIVDKSVHTAGTLGVTHTVGTRNFVAKDLTAVEAGSVAMVYMVRDGEAAITANNYTNYVATSTQTATGLTTGLNFSATVDTYGLAIAASQDYDVYVVVKDATGNVKVLNAAVTTGALQ